MPLSGSGRCRSPRRLYLSQPDAQTGSDHLVSPRTPAGRGPQCPGVRQLVHDFPDTTGGFQNVHPYAQLQRVQLPTEPLRIEPGPLNERRDVRAMQLRNLIGRRAETPTRRPRRTRCGGSYPDAPADGRRS